MKRILALGILLLLACYAPAFAGSGGGGGGGGSGTDGDYYISQVSGGSGTWSAANIPNFNAGETTSGHIDVGFLNNGDELNDYSNLIGVAFYADWDHVIDTLEELQNSSLVPVFSATANYSSLVQDDAGNILSADWNIPWSITPGNGPTGTTQGLWIVESLDDDETWGGSDLISSNYFEENTPEAYGQFTLNQNAATPEPSSILLLGMGLLGLAGFGRKRKS